ncbi:hypothetical protein AVEN_211513-1 [Araneus ventricosus]|uniref:Uncharacterized protein n=1 Tax=Araneus ventricosus TaxID=182803 RepID=A0A4Y2JPF9_ARAVE|nr:hypothetical protein AVEN_211513-1 [Araneus ventricosus]
MLIKFHFDQSFYNMHLGDIAPSYPKGLGHGPFPSYLFRFGKHPDNCCACGEPGTPHQYATKCHLTLSYHVRCPADQYLEAWMKSITNHRLLTNKIIDLLNFIISQEDVLKSEQPATLACIVHPTTKLPSLHALLLLSPGTFHARDRSSASVSQCPDTCSPRV